MRNLDGGSRWGPRCGGGRGGRGKAGRGAALGMAGTVVRVVWSRRAAVADAGRLLGENLGFFEWTEWSRRTVGRWRQNCGLDRSRTWAAHRHQVAGARRGWSRLPAENCVGKTERRWAWPCRNSLKTGKKSSAAARVDESAPAGTSDVAKGENFENWVEKCCMASPPAEESAPAAGP